MQAGYCSLPQAVLLGLLPWEAAHSCGSPAVLEARAPPRWAPRGDRRWSPRHCAHCVELHRPVDVALSAASLGARTHGGHGAASSSLAPGGRRTKFASLLQVRAKSYVGHFDWDPVSTTSGPASSRSDASEHESESWFAVHAPRNHAAWLALGVFVVLFLALLYSQLCANRRNKKRTPAVLSKTDDAASSHMTARRSVSTETGRVGRRASISFGDEDDLSGDAAIRFDRIKSERGNYSREYDFDLGEVGTSSIGSCQRYGSISDESSSSTSNSNTSSSSDAAAMMMNHQPSSDVRGKVASGLRRVGHMHTNMYDGEEDDDEDGAPCDYVLVFPLRGSKSKEMHWSGTNFVVIDWDERVDGFEKACKVFRGYRCNPLVSEEELRERFDYGQLMSNKDYHDRVRTLLAELLVGSQLGLHAKAVASEGENDVFLKLSIPRDVRGEIEGLRRLVDPNIIHESSRENSSSSDDSRKGASKLMEKDAHPPPRTLHEYAMVLRYRMPLSDEAYRTANGESMPLNKDGKPIPGYAEFFAQKWMCFQPFKQLDIIRLLTFRLYKHFNVPELENQGVLVEHFPAHNKKEATQLKLLTTWSNWTLWYQLPDERMDDRIRDYFGEEVAFTFAWQCYFTTMLALPAALGGLVFLRRFFLHSAVQQAVQGAYAGFMIVWVSFFTSSWDRKEARMKQSWGTDREMRGGSEMRAKPWHNVVHDHHMFVVFVKIFADVGVLVMLLLSITLTYAISRMRQDMMKTNPGFETCVGFLAAMCTSAQIFMLDFSWRHASRWLTDHENHKYPEQWNAAWVERCFYPRLFTNIYPFVYLGFLKKHVDHCPDTPKGCLDELEMNLATHFMSRVVSQMACDLFLIAYVHCNLMLERYHRGKRKKRPAVEIQAKSFPYDETFTLNEWTEQALTFAFVTCFSLVLPAICGIALLSNMLECRLVAHRDIQLLRRPLPQYASGIGIWRKLLNAVALLSVILNVGFAIFVMEPLCHHPTHLKWIYFVCSEHVIHVLRLFAQTKFPRIPEDVDEVNEKNETVVRLLFSAVHKQHRGLEVHQTAPDITPDRFHKPSDEELPRTLDTKQEHRSEAAGSSGQPADDASGDSADDEEVSSSDDQSCLGDVSQDLSSIAGIRRTITKNVGEEDCGSEINTTVIGSIVLGVGVGAVATYFLLSYLISHFASMTHVV